MILWITALVLMALAGYVGSLSGGIRAACSLIGLIVAALLAKPLSPVIRPLAAVMTHNPIYLEIIPPVVVFLLLLIIFKVVAFNVHHKARVYYNYKVADERRFMWERLNSRLGLCIGLLNGAIYFFLLMIPVYVFGYLTVQVASGEEMPKTVQILNQAREQLHTTKIDRFVAAHDPAPEQFYDGSDIIALVQHNPLLESRLRNYPDFLAIAERPEFQAIASDVELNKLIQSQASIRDILNHPKVQAIVNNPEIVNELMRTLRSDLKDLHGYLETGKSAKYDAERLLGRWDFSRKGTINSETSKRGTLSPTELGKVVGKISPYFGSTLTAMPDGKLLFKRAENAGGNQPPVIGEGTWVNQNGTYQMTLNIGGNAVTMDGTLMTDTRWEFPYLGLTFVFEKQQ